MRMRFEGYADVTKVVFRRDKEGAKMAVPTVSFACDAERSEELFGSPFTDMVFGPLSATGEWGFEKIVPDVVFEKHALQLGEKGPVLHTMPKFDRVEPVENTASLLIMLKLPYEYQHAALVTPLVESFGDGLQINLAPLNGDVEEAAREFGRKIADDNPFA